MDTPTLSQDTPAWRAFVSIAFGLSVTLMVVGIWVLPVVLWIKGYLAMGLFFTISSTLTLSKTVRDHHEAQKIVNRVSEAKTERLLKEFDLKG
jgi:hypothetical protein